MQILGPKNNLPMHVLMGNDSTMTALVLKRLMYGVIAAV
jgi:hypothetical protein